MKIKPILADMSGRLQGIVASHNRGGQYFRGRTVPITPPTAPQTAIRLILANLVSNWKAVLTDAQRIAWNDFAVISPVIDGFGSSVNAGGLGNYIKHNLSRSLAGLGASSTPPIGSGVAFLTAPTPSENGGDIDVAIDNTDPWANDDNGRLLIFVSKPVPTSRYSAAGISKAFLATISGNSVTPPTSPVNVNLIPDWPAGTRIFFRFKAVDGSGGVSANFETFADS